MNNKVIGTTLLVVGTSVGGGMLALPAVTAAASYWQSGLLFIFAWAVMTFGAFLMVEVNLWYHKDNNIVSMAKNTLGHSGAIIAWITYLGLLYALVSAYIAGGSGVVKSIMFSAHINSPNWLNTILFTFILGAIVWHGIRSVDRVNRLFMSLKLFVYAGLILLIAPHINFTQLTGGHPHYLFGAITIVVTSFGFAGSIPTFCSYLDYNPKHIRLAVLVGSLITLACYLIWDIAVQGSISRSNLIAMTHGNTTDMLTMALSQIAANSWISWFAHLFTSICMLTSFMGVSLGLSDFLSDGMKVNKTQHKLLIYGTTFLPPLCITLFYPQAFITALSFAGIFCLILLALLPALMVWRGRYQQKVRSAYRVLGGKYMVAIELVIAAALIIVAILEKIN